MASTASLKIRPPPSQASSRHPSSGPDSDSSGIFRRPALLPRHLPGSTSNSSPLALTRNGIKRAFDDHSDSDGGVGAEDPEDELVTGFDEFGVQGVHAKLESAGPLVIPALANRDWRAVAAARKQKRYVPDSAHALVGSGRDSTQDRPDVHDVINRDPVAVGLVIKKESSHILPAPSVKLEPLELDLAHVKPQIEESEDDKARRLLLASLSADGENDVKPIIAAIPMAPNDFAAPADETDAFRMDVVTRPESSSLEDYARVPIEQFGAAMLRGMGWQEGVSTGRRGMAQIYLPAARPAFLGIGAKERPKEDIPSLVGKKKPSGKPDMQYRPLVRKERLSASAPHSQVPSRSVSPVHRASGGTSRRSPSPARERSRDHRERRDGGGDASRPGRGTSHSTRDRDRELPSSDRDRSHRSRGSDGDADRHPSRNHDRARDHGNRERSGERGARRHLDRDSSRR